MAAQTFDLFAERKSSERAEDKRALRVSELNDRAAAMLEERFCRVLVEGEISGFLAHRSGHWYFTLKDQQSQVNCCCFKGSQRFIAAPPKDGDHVVVRGKLTVYGPRGSYQLVVEHVKAAGAGALLEKLEALKAKLGAEGLFSSERKRALPKVVRTIGLVTSPDGAAVQDYLRVALQRDPGLRVIVFPTQVQGAAAAPELTRAIALASSRAQALALDAIVVTRGGGAIEDLWAFNEEAVVRAIAVCCVPVVSAVGHEVDTTLADFAADLRAPTPTAAAQLTSADMASVRDLFLRRERELARALRAAMDRRRARMQHARLKLEDPRRRIARMQQRLDLVTQEMENALHERLGKAHKRLRALELALQTHHPRRHIADQSARLKQLRSRLERASIKHIAEHKQRLARLAATLDALSPLAVLGRGYALVRTQEGALVRGPQDVRAGETIAIHLERGELRAIVKGDSHE